LPRQANGLFQVIYASVDRAGLPEQLQNLHHALSRQDLEIQARAGCHQFNAAGASYAVKRIDWFGTATCRIGIVWSYDPKRKTWDECWNEKLCRKIFDE